MILNTHLIYVSYLYKFQSNLFFIFKTFDKININNFKLDILLFHLLFYYLNCFVYLFKLYYSKLKLEHSIYSPLLLDNFLNIFDLKKNRIQKNILIDNK